MCINETTKLPDDKRCPAFALAVRNEPSEGDGTQSNVKEAVLVIRGTKSSMDWTINLDEEALAYTYIAGGPDFSATLSSSAATATNPREVVPVEGRVHSGMLRAAKGILDDYGLRSVLIDLIARGYSVTIAGHSLGAGTAAIVAMELKQALLEVFDTVAGRNPVSKAASEEDVTVEFRAAAVEHAAAQGVRMGPNLAPPRLEGKPLQVLNNSKSRLVESVKAGLVPSLQVVGYGTAPCVCEILAEAIR